MIKIKHARPDVEYFMICQPARKKPYGERVNWDDRPDFNSEIYELTDPKDSDVKIKAELIAIYQESLDAREIMGYNNFALLAYGLSIKKLIHIFKKRYKNQLDPANPKIEFLLMKQL